ncbi:MAG: chemotaxis protein CheV [Candidatus Marinimicrobia bacterium]|nr:chemotaxis protein CheV [Candidatus Neomarinimicrobiota bacterium]
MKNRILLETGTNEMELLAVEIDHQYFGMNVAKVQSIQQYDPKLVTKMPIKVPGIIGRLTYRKRNIPLIDLASILGRNDPPGDSKQIVVVTEFNNSLNSFKVHGVNQIYRLSWERLTPLKGIMNKNSFVTGSVIIDDHEILVLDLEYILAMLFPELTLEEVSNDVVDQGRERDRNQLKIYFAEDSNIIRKGVISALNKVGYHDITEFGDGKIAYDFFMEIKEKSSADMSNSVLISDIEMPEMDGLTLCKNLKNDPDLGKIHITMFSSLINRQMIEKCKSVGADNYVTKPEVNRLIHILDTFCKN